MKAHPLAERLRQLESTRGMVRARAATALGAAGETADDAVVTALCELAVSDPWWYARRAAIDALARLADPSAVSVLCQALFRDGSDTVRRSAAAGLRAFGGPQAVAALRRALVDPDVGTAYRAADALLDLEPGRTSEQWLRQALQVDRVWLLPSAQALRGRLEELLKKREELELRRLPIPSSPELAPGSLPLPADGAPADPAVLPRPTPNRQRG